MKKSKIIVFIVVMTMLLATLSACSMTTSFKINFEVDGAQYDSVETRGQEVISLPADPTKKDCIFDGWYFDKGVWEKPLTMTSILAVKQTSKITVYAKWLKNLEVIFSANGGSEIATQKVLEGNFATAPTAPTKEGFVFGGWYKEASFATAFNFSADKITENTTIYAKWLTIFDLTFETNGGSAVEAQKVTDGSFASQPIAPTKKSSSFDGWYKEESFATSFNFATDKITGNTTIYAKWKGAAVDSFLTFTFTDSSNSAYSVAQRPATTLPQIIALPAEYKGKPVVAIGDNAFGGCSSLTSITIPASVTNIGMCAFGGCSGLTSITIPASVTSIGYGAFGECSGLTSITIPAGVTSIGDIAFGGCSSLTSVIIPASVTSIGNGAFSGCSSLTSVIIPAGVTSIGESTFAGCSSLTNIMVESGNANYQSIEGNLYSKDGSTLMQYAIGKTATEFTIPAGVTSIGDTAFDGCSRLTIYVEAASKPAGWGSGWNGGCPVVWDSVNNIIASDGNIYAVLEGIRYALKDGNATVVNQPSTITTANIPKAVTFNNLRYSVTSIIFDAFYGCSSLTNITVDSGNAKYKSIDGNLYSKDGSTLLQYAVGKTATSFTIPAGVIMIFPFAFAYCSSLTSITIPEGVTMIFPFAFAYCSSLTSITIPASVTSIALGAFSNCSSLTSVTFKAGSKLTSIGNQAFNGCSSLTSVTFEAGSKLESIGEGAFDGCSSLTSMTIPASVTSIEESAFRDCSSLTSITIPAGVTSIGDYAFDGCSSLTSVTIPDGVTSIGRYAFNGCSSLTSVTIPAGVTSIGEGAFSGCSSLTSVTIPAGVTSIGEGAFSGCSSLTNITVESGNTKYKSIDGNLYSKDGSTLIQYAIGKTATSFTIPASVTSIGGEAFAYCSSLTSITIPEGVTSIGGEAFAYCSSLTSITIPEGVTSIGGQAFALCSSLTSITIPASVTSIGDVVFAFCSSLTIYAEAGSLPAGWNQSWNLFYDGKVVWGHKN